MRAIDRPPRSWAGDPSVPPFDERRILLVMDGHCAICSAAARRIARWDREDAVRIAPAHSPLGAALLAHFGHSPEDPDTWLMIEDGRAYGSLDAIIRLGGRLKPWLKMMGALRILPGGVQDWLYARLARNRYALFGRGDLCAMPDEALRRRLVG